MAGCKQEPTGFRNYLLTLALSATITLLSGCATAHRRNTATVNANQVSSLFSNGPTEGLTVSVSGTMTRDDNNGGLHTFASDAKSSDGSPLVEIRGIDGYVDDAFSCNAVLQVVGVKNGTIQLSLDDVKGKDGQSIPVG